MNPDGKFSDTSELISAIKNLKQSRLDPSRDLNLYKPLIDIVIDLALSHPEILVRQFHEVYKVHIGDIPDISDATLRDFRKSLLDEEYIEYCIANDFIDMKEMFDALLDVIYIAYGSGISFGFPMNKGFVEVQRSNMTKLDENGRPIIRKDGKILKGPNFEKPDLNRILEETK